MYAEFEALAGVSTAQIGKLGMVLMKPQIYPKVEHYSLDALSMPQIPQCD